MEEPSVHKMAVTGLRTRKITVGSSAAKDGQVPVKQAKLRTEEVQKERSKVLG